MRKLLMKSNQGRRLLEDITGEKIELIWAPSAPLHHAGRRPKITFT